MKRLLILCGILLGCALQAEEVLNLWSGREITLPGNGNWTLFAEHGRILATGNGEIRFEVAALERGMSLDAKLTIGKKSQKIRFYPPELLYGINITSDNTVSDKILSALIEMGAGLLAEPSFVHPEIPAVVGLLPENAVNKITLCFMGKSDFPLDIKQKWEKISVVRAKNPGTLGISYNKDEQIMDNSGNLTYIMLQHDNRCVVIFSPEFDLDLIDNVLLIKQIIEEKRK